MLEEFSRFLKIFHQKTSIGFNEGKSHDCKVRESKFPQEFLIGLSLIRIKNLANERILIIMSTSFYPFAIFTSGRFFDRERNPSIINQNPDSSDLIDFESDHEKRIK